MKQVFKDKIINIDQNYFDNKFLFEIYDFSKGVKSNDVEIIFLEDLLKNKKNNELLEKVKVHPAMWSEVFSPKDEFEIFTSIFENAIKTEKRTHIIGVTLGEEIEILEKYYDNLGFFDESINCFKVDYKIPLVSVSVNIRNLMWRGSDYKRFGKNIFFIPPIREAGQVKAMFKGVNRGSIAGIFIESLGDDEKTFLQNQIKEEHILPLTMAKVLNYNYEDLGLECGKVNIEINY
nr:hypothetical protein [Candidatus Gracilibacteria bacterium]